MKNTAYKKWIIIVILLSILSGAILCISQISHDKKVSGEWQLDGILDNYELKFGNHGEYEYFNINLSEDGIINIFSYPEKFAVLGTYSFLEKVGNSYTYIANLFVYSDNGEVEPFGAKFTYNTNEDRLYLFLSEDDGMFFERTEELTTIEITTTEKSLQDYVGRYGNGYYNEYEDFYEKEVNIVDITDTNVVFDIEHYRLMGQENVVATKNEQGFYYFELTDVLCCGYVLFEDSNIIIDITKGDEFFVKLGKTTYHKVQDKSNLKPAESNVSDENYYKSSCERNVNSKNLVRFEQEYLNQNFCYIGQVFSSYPEDEVFKIITDENCDNLYGDNFIYAQDCRISDKTKILEGDIITVYGKFTGVSTDDCPCFKFYYADIEGIQ